MISLICAKYQSYCVSHAEMIAVLQNALRLIVFEKIENQKSSSTRTFSEISRKRKHEQFSFKTRKIEEITRNFLVRFLIFLKKVGCPSHGRAVLCIFSKFLLPTVPTEEQAKLPHRSHTSDNITSVKFKNQNNFNIKKQLKPKAGLNPMTLLVKENN